jgi:hypothetical protein
MLRRERFGFSNFACRNLRRSRVDSAPKKSTESHRRASSHANEQQASDDGNRVVGARVKEKSRAGWGARAKRKPRGLGRPRKGKQRGLGRPRKKNSAPRSGMQPGYHEVCDEVCRRSPCETYSEFGIGSRRESCGPTPYDAHLLAYGAASGQASVPRETRQLLQKPLRGFTLEATTSTDGSARKRRTSTKQHCVGSCARLGCARFDPHARAAD